MYSILVRLVPHPSLLRVPKHYEPVPITKSVTPQHRAVFSTGSYKRARSYIQTGTLFAEINGSLVGCFWEFSSLATPKVSTVLIIEQQQKAIINTSTEGNHISKAAQSDENITCSKPKQLSKCDSTYITTYSKTSLRRPTMGAIFKWFI